MTRLDLKYDKSLIASNFLNYVRDKIESKISVPKNNIEPKDKSMQFSAVAIRAKLNIVGLNTFQVINSTSPQIERSQHLLIVNQLLWLNTLDKRFLKKHLGINLRHRRII